LKNSKNFLSTSLVILILINPVFALDVGVSLLESLVNWLRIIAISIVTIAIMWAGFKVIFRGTRIDEVAPIIIGGILIGGAAYFASWLLG